MGRVDLDARHRHKRRERCREVLGHGLCAFLEKLGDGEGPRVRVGERVRAGAVPLLLLEGREALVEALVDVHGELLCERLAELLEEGG